MQLGGIIKSDQGRWIIGFTKFNGTGSIELVKAWALYLGLKVVISLEINRIKIVIDCQEIYHLLTKNDNLFHPLHSLISNCRHTLCALEDHKISKISRKQDTCADLLSKVGKKPLFEDHFGSSNLHLVSLFTRPCEILIPPLLFLSHCFVCIGCISYRLLCFISLLYYEQFILTLVLVMFILIKGYNFTKKTKNSRNSKLRSHCLMAFSLNMHNNNNNKANEIS